MTGADIIGELLHGYKPLTAVIPAGQIKGGRLPPGISLPALLVRNVSSVERQRLKRGASVHTRDRVSVTVRARTYDEQIRVMDLVEEACADRIGPFAGSERASVLTAGRGPDLGGPGDSYEQAQDFRVSFDKPNNRKD